MGKIFVKKIDLWLQAIFLGDLCKQNMLLEKSYLQYELKCINFSINNLLSTKNKRSKNCKNIANTKCTFLILNNEKAWLMKQFSIYIF